MRSRKKRPLVEEEEENSGGFRYDYNRTSRKAEGINILRFLTDYA
jgi:hypothetical protein